MMNATWATNETAAKFEARHLVAAAHFIRTPLDSDEDQADFRSVFMKPPFTACACPVNPYRLPERLTIQHGVFVCAGDVTKPFEENMQATGPDHTENVYAFIIPAREIQEGLKYLYDLNISDASLCPGLDGFARSLDVNLASAPPRLPLS